MRITERRRSVGRWLAARIVISLALASAAGAPAAWAAAPEPLSAFPRSVLAVRTAAGRVIDFRVWIANTPRRAEQGLMFLHALGDRDGMLFPFSAGRPVVMWMKNTYVPLDMLFVDSRGRIDAITKRARPLSLALIYGPEGTRAVVELHGGSCDRLGIRVGDRVLSDALR
jgi:uncharacterized protein